MVFLFFVQLPLSISVSCFHLALASFLNVLARFSVSKARQGICLSVCSFHLGAIAALRVQQPLSPTTDMSALSGGSSYPDGRSGVGAGEKKTPPIERHKSSIRGHILFE